MCPSVKVEQIEPKKVQVVIDIPAEEIQQEKEKTLQSLSRQVSIPGFRPGKVPVKVLQNIYSDEEITRRAIDDVWQKHFREAIKNYRLQPVEKPKVDVSPRQEGILISALIEVVPKVQVRSYAHLKVEVEEVPPVTETMVEQEIQRFREEFATLTPVERQSRWGDVVLVSQNSRKHHFFLQEGNRAMEPLVNRRKSDEVSLPVEGKEPVHAKVEEVFERSLPDDAALLKKMEAPSMEVLKESVKKTLELRSRQLQESLTEQAVLEALFRQIVEVDLPEALLEEEIEERFHDLFHSLGDDENQLEAYIHQKWGSYEKWKESAREGAKKTLLLRLALDEVAEMEGLKVYPEEIDHRLERWANREGLKKDVLRRKLEKRGWLNSLERQVLREKTVDFLISKGEIQYRKGGVR